MLYEKLSYVYLSFCIKMARNIEYILTAIYCIYDMCDVMNYAMEDED